MEEAERVSLFVVCCGSVVFSPLFFHAGLVAITLSLVAASALISAAEAAFFSLTPEAIAQCNQSRTTADKRIVFLLGEKKNCSPPS